MHSTGNGLIKQYQVVDCDFNQIFYSGIVGDRFDVPPAYAKVKVVWVNPMLWPELKENE